MCFDFLYKFCLKHFSFWEELNGMWSKVYIGLHVQYQLFLAHINKSWIFSIVFKSFKFHENMSSGNRVVPCGGTDGKTHDEANSRFSQFCERV